MSELNPEMADRAARAQRIIDKPGGYKVCEGCESIVVLKAGTCPNCQGYRFDSSAERVIQRAEIWGRARPPHCQPKILNKTFNVQRSTLNFER